MSKHVAIWDNRPKWSRHIEFIISCIGSAVGLGNVWRYPYLVFNSGGGAFLIPYTITLFILGIPLMCLELAFGQFASLGPITIWEINPMFKGLGYSMVLITFVICIYYNVILALAIYYLFSSLRAELPWASCGNKWNTCACRTAGMNRTLSDGEMWYAASGLNCTGKHYTHFISPSEEYYYNRVWDQTTGIQDLGELKWDLTLCNFLAWVLVCLTVIKGVRSIGKASYLFALSPYIFITMLTVRGVTLDGAERGLRFYLMPDMAAILRSDVWMNAAAQIIFSLSLASGVMIVMASYNDFRANFIRDSVVICIVNCVTSFYTGFATFSVLGFISKVTGSSVKDVTKQGTGLVFVAYPQALAHMPVSQVWSFLFFLNLLFMGLSTQYSCVETVITSIQDEFPELRTPARNYITRIGVCLILFLLGLPQTTQGGQYLVDFCDYFTMFPLLILSLAELIVIVWVYGYDRLTEDFFLMLGHGKVNDFLYNKYFSWNFKYASPIITLAILIFNVVTYEPIISKHFPWWSEVLGWMFAVFIVMWIPVCYLYKLWQNRKVADLSWKQMNQPTPNWGPARPKHRTLPRYQALLKQGTPGGNTATTTAAEAEEDPPSVISDNDTTDTFASVASQDNHPDDQLVDYPTRHKGYKKTTFKNRTSL